MANTIEEIKIIINSKISPILELNGFRYRKIIILLLKKELMKMNLE